MTKSPKSELPLTMFAKILFPINSLSMHCIIIKIFIEYNCKLREIDVHYLQTYIIYYARYMISLTLFSIYRIEFPLEKKNEQMCLMTSLTFMIGTCNDIDM